ncbi:MAG: CSLREA domain-containing protein [Dokdonella sp.]
MLKYICQSAFLAAIGLLAPLPGRALVHPSITVTDSADTDASSGGCTLRAAIVAANTQASYHACTLSSPAAGGATYIDFAIGGNTAIHVDSALPTITVPVVIDGLSQPGADCSHWPPTLAVTLDNPNNGDYNGLVLGAGSSGSIIRGLVVNSFANSGSSNFTAAIVVESAYNHVECNFIGTDASGMVAKPNLRGVDLVSMQPGSGDNSAHDNVIGSDGAALTYVARNLITANAYGQIDTRGYAPYGNRISGNYVGTDVTGTRSLTTNPASGGIDIGGGNAPAYGNFVGWDGQGDPTLMRNIISGLASPYYGGVTFEVGAHDNRVAGNYIGTDPSGTQAVPNVIGVLVGSNANVYHNLIGNDGSQDASSARNVISGNAFIGVEFDGSNSTYDNALIGNSIGVDATGRNLLGNGSYGVSINFASANTLVARNWIAGNATAIRFFAIGGFGGNSTASFINNANGANPALPAIDSSGNCILASSGVIEDPQGSSVPTTTFAGNWWGASSGPNTAGASSADIAVIATPFLLAPATPCSEVIFADGFESM